MLKQLGGDTFDINGRAVNAHIRGWGGSLLYDRR